MQSQLGAVDGEHASHEPARRIGVGKLYYRRIKVDGIAVGSSLVELLAGCISQLYIERRFIVVTVVFACAIDKGNPLGGLLALVGKSCHEGESVT